MCMYWYVCMYRCVYMLRYIYVWMYVLCLIWYMYIVYMYLCMYVLNVAWKASVVLLSTGELYLTLVTSTKANAKIVSVDPSAALAMKGVVSFLDHTSVIKSNMVGKRIGKEEIFASKEVSISWYPYSWCSYCFLVIIVTVIIIIYYYYYFINIRYVMYYYLVWFTCLIIR